MRQKSVALVAGLIVAFTFHATAAPADDSGEVVEPEVFECDSDDVPDTSITEKFRNDVLSLLDPEGYDERYPDECKSWAEEYRVGSGESNSKYAVEVMKYAGDEWDAVIMVERNGGGVRYANVELDGESIGATDSQGMLKTELPEDFSITVNTSDGEFTLEGTR